MNPAKGEELFIGNQGNEGNGRIERDSHTLKKCGAFFAFRSGLHHSRKFDARGDIPYCTAVTTTTRASQPNGLGCSEVTSSQSGYDPRLPTRRVGMLRDDQVGAWLSSAHCLVPPTSKTINRFWKEEPHPPSREVDEIHD